MNLPFTVESSHELENYRSAPDLFDQCADGRPAKGHRMFEDA